MNMHRTSGIVALALAAGSAIAASPAPSGDDDLWSQMGRMTQGSGMMGPGAMHAGGAAPAPADW